MRTRIGAAGALALALLATGCGGFAKSGGGTTDPAKRPDKKPTASMASVPTETAAKTTSRSPSPTEPPAARSP
ncbi:hypothetical protein ACH4TX_11485 [Streptomyces sp. NPDC021098]|uniref:hypothetical protein n=1 Tax=unclassified Streptomyces TaxID=2593676 RepID=UPI0037A4355F